MPLHDDAFGERPCQLAYFVRNLMSQDSIISGRKAKFGTNGGSEIHLGNFAAALDTARPAVQLS